MAAMVAASSLIADRTSGGGLQFHSNLYLDFIDPKAVTSGRPISGPPTRT